MDVYVRIKNLREERGLSQQELAEMVGYKTASAVNKIELGLRDLNQSKIRAFAQALGVTPGYLMGDNDAPKSKGVKIPVLGYVRAGLPMTAAENIIDYEEIASEMARQGEHFGLIIKGDSMEPKFSEDDVVIVRKQDTIDNGDIAVVLINGDEATVKKFYRTDAGIKLVATNPKYDPFFYTPDEVNALPVQIIGKVVELRAKF